MNKFDPKLKAELLAQQAEITERAKRDADEERKIAEHDFTSGANTFTP